MPRPTRIQYDNAFYHVMNRGRGRMTIYPNENYYQAFLETLEEAWSRFDAVIHAYCLMGNHYHLLIETPRANLDRIMRHINGVYTQRYNRLKHTDGPLFRGRYKAILVDRDGYLLSLSRYIHRNPIETNSKLVNTLSDWRWSSYPAYINQAVAPAWLHRETTYRMLGQRQRYNGYRRFVDAGNSPELLQLYNRGNMASVIGDRAFREDIAERREELTVNAELPKILNERPAIEDILQAVGRHYGVSVESISRRKQGRQVANVPRKVAMYLCQHYGDLSMREIATAFKLTNPAGVSGAVSWVKKGLESGELRLGGLLRDLNYIK